MVTDSDGVISIDRCRDHYRHCIRLAASNKINSKNAFDLNLIDFMQDLVSTQTEDEQMNFKIASSALDVGAKIYSNRVDRIQSEAQKVASSILMALDGQQNKNGDNPDDTQMDGDTSAGSDRLNDSRDGEDQPKAKKKRPNSRRNVKTVVEDDTNLNDPKLEKIPLSDPFMDGLSKDYDMSHPAALCDHHSMPQEELLHVIESALLRRDYQKSQQPKIKPTLEIIAEEDDEQQEENADRTIEDLESSRQNGEVDIDGDGDRVMKADQQKSSSDKTTASTASLGDTIDPCAQNASRNHSNPVSLMTKKNNCAKIIRDNENNQLCPRVSTFLFNDRTTKIIGHGNSDLDDSRVPQNNNLNISSDNAGGAHGVDLEQLPTNDNDDYGDDHIGDADSLVGDDENHVNENDPIPDLDRVAASKPSEYFYSAEHHRLLNIWRGPDGWKAIKAPQTTKKDGPPKSARKRAKLEQIPIDFAEEIDKEREAPADKSIRHSSDVIKKWKKPILPPDHNLTEDVIRDTITHKFLRPEETYHCMRTPADAAKVVDNDHDYSRAEDIDGDATPGGLGGFDDVHDDSDDEFRADPLGDGNQVAIFGSQMNDTLMQQADLEFAGENLIEQPYTVAQVQIPFSKIAKKMDVRRLKRVMWDLLLPPEKRLELTMQANVTVVENGTGDKDKTIENGHSSVMSGDEHDVTVVMNGDTSEQTKKKTPSPTPSESAVHLEFSHLYCELPVRVSSKMASDLSQPIAFVTLLHLANEKNLKLIPKEDLKDFIIEQDELN